MMYRGLAVIALIALIAAYMLPGGTVYNVPLAEAHRTLAATGLPPMVFGTETPAWEVRESGSDVIWIVRKDDAEIFRHVAHLKEVAQRSTRAEVDLLGAQSGPSGNVA